MSERDTYPAGVPCWVEALHDDPRAAAAFYDTLLGWELVSSEPEPGEDEYLVARLRGRDVAGIGTLPRSGKGMAPAWATHVRVENAEAAGEAVKAAGGEVLDGPIDAAPAGRFAVLAGLMVGFAGVVALVGIDVAGEPRELLGAAAILLAAAGYATGPLLIKRGLTEVDPRATTAGALIVAALILTPAALAAPPDTMPPIEALASLAVLGVFCTALAFVLFTALVGEVGPGRATVITYVAPLVALTLGVAALDERPGAGAVIGLALIVAGSSLATRPPTTNVQERDLDR